MPVICRRSSSASASPPPHSRRRRSRSRSRSRPRRRRRSSSRGGVGGREADRKGVRPKATPLELTSAAKSTASELGCSFGVTGVAQPLRPQLAPPPPPIGGTPQGDGARSGISRPDGHGLVCKSASNAAKPPPSKLTTSTLQPGSLVGSIKSLQRPAWWTGMSSGDVPLLAPPAQANGSFAAGYNFTNNSTEAGGDRPRLIRRPVIIAPRSGGLGIQSQQQNDENALSFMVKQMIKSGNFDAIPQAKLNELRAHIQYLLDAEAAEPPPVFTAACEMVEETDDEAVPVAADAFVDSAEPSDSNEPADAEQCSGADHAESLKLGEHLESAGQHEEATSGDLASLESAFTDGVALPETVGDQKTAKKVGVVLKKTTPKKTKMKLRSVVLSPAWREGALSATELLLRRRLEAASPNDAVPLTLRQIHYSQESIKGLFRDGRSIATMRRELALGLKKLDDIPQISAVVQAGRVYSVDNRRLWTFKHCGMPMDMRIMVRKSTQNIGFHRKLTTLSNGRTIRKRGEAGFA